VINSSTNKGLRRLYNANSKNRVGLRGCKGKRTCGIVERGMGDAIGWRDGQETIRTRAATSSLLDTTAYRQPLRIPSRTLRLRTLRFFSTSQLGTHRRRFNLHTTDHVFRLAFTFSSPYFTTIDQAPIVFASTHPHFTTRIGCLRAGGCSLVTTLPHVHLLCTHTDFVWLCSNRESR